jgi:putative addiction module component (TIGR02574 family)
MPPIIGSGYVLSSRALGRRSKIAQLLDRGRHVPKIERLGLGVGGIIDSVTEKTSNLLQQALALSEEERADLASSLLDSLDPTVDEDASAAWDQEIARRIADLDSGRAKTIPWDKVRGRMLSKLSNGKKEN